MSGKTKIKGEKYLQKIYIHVRVLFGQKQNHSHPVVQFDFGFILFFQDFKNCGKIGIT